MDHGDIDYIGAGTENHNAYFDKYEAGNLTNSTKPNVLYSIACLSGRLKAYCFADGFMRNANGGGLAFVGNGGYGCINRAQAPPTCQPFIKRSFSKVFLTMKSFKSAEPLQTIRTKIIRVATIH